MRDTSAAGIDDVESGRFPQVDLVCQLVGLQRRLHVYEQVDASNGQADPEAAGNISRCSFCSGHLDCKGKETCLSVTGDPQLVQVIPQQ